MKRLWKTARIVWNYDKTRRLLTETAAEPGKTVATSYGYDKVSNRISKLVATIGKDAHSPHRPTSAQEGILRGQVRGGKSTLPAFPLSVRLASIRPLGLRIPKLVMYNC